jgi:hypothetical protein
MSPIDADLCPLPKTSLSLSSRSKSVSPKLSLLSPFTSLSKSPPTPWSNPAPELVKISKQSKKSKKISLQSPKTPISCPPPKVVKCPGKVSKKAAKKSPLLALTSPKKSPLLALTSPKKSFSSPLSKSPKKSPLLALTSPKKSFSSPLSKSPKKSTSGAQSSCVRLTDKKYMERPSPPFSAADCQGLSLLGNNGKMFVSLPNKNGIYTWREKK